jgi:hypothetical protein
VTRLIATLSALAALAAPCSAPAAIFGTTPLNISVAANGAPANGSSGGAAVSGDNRKTRLAAFWSDATNLVGDDTNDATDVFVWFRPRGGQGLELRPGAGSLQRVSVGAGGRQANGPSRNPSLDGSVAKAPHCVAFQSEASNLAAGDADKTADIFVRDLRAKQTRLVSRGISGAASDPSIDGACRNVAFVSGNRILVAGVASGRPRVIGTGRNPDFSLDGSAVTWERGNSIVLRRNGRTSVVGPGQNPTVSDAERLSGRKGSEWGVSFETRAGLVGRDHNPGYDMYMRVFGPSGGVKRTDLISAAARGAGSLGGDNYNGGITAYAPNRGILVFTNTDGESSDLYYRNNNSGNIDDLAHAAALAGTPGITEVQTSARANFVAFSSSYVGDLSRPFSGRLPRGVPGGSIDDLFSATQNVYFKHLIDGEPV